MRSKADETQPDIFDPFWVFFAEDDEFSDEETNRRRFGRKHSSKTAPPNNDDSSSLLDYFIPEEDFLGLGGEQREPTSSGYKRRQELSSTSKPSSWRQSQPRKEKRRGFGIKSKSRRNAIAGNDSTSWTSDRRDMPSGNIPKRRNAIYKKQDSSSDADSDIFPNEAFPSFMDALAAPWDPWGDQESTDESSVASYTDESSKNDESTATASLASLSLGTHEPQEVQQILVQFNPKADAATLTQETSSVTKYSNAPMQSSRVVNNDINNIPPQNTSWQAMHQNDDSTIGIYERFDQEFAIAENREHNNGFFSPQMLVCCSAKNNGQSSRFSCRGGPNPKDEQDFPKLRFVADEKAGDHKNSTVVSKIKDFKGNVPAHLQVSPDAFLPTKGPQSLYEYEYDGAEHMDIAYNHFGSNPLSLLVIRHHLTPPLVTEDGAVVQVEVCSRNCTRKFNTQPFLPS